MKRLCERSVAVILVLSLLSVSVFAKTDLGDWGNIERLKINSTILVETKRGERFEGKLLSATSDSMSVRVKVVAQLYASDRGAP